jgi:hypothetical protein
MVSVVADAQDVLARPDWSLALASRVTANHFCEINLVVLYVLRQIELCPNLV